MYVERNNAIGRGGGVFYGGRNGIIILNSIISDNSTEARGGGAYVSGPAYVDNVLITLVLLPLAGCRAPVESQEPE